MAAIYAAHMEDLDDWQADDSDAFQNTVTDGSDGTESVAPVYSFPAPGFEEYDEDGELLCYEHRTAEYQWHASLSSAIICVPTEDVAACYRLLRSVIITLCMQCSLSVAIGGGGK